MNSTQTGNQAEEAAARYLVNSGFKILERQWRYKKREIDIIAREGEKIVFVEVKGRGTNLHGDPEDFVGRRKQGFLISAAHEYLVTHDIEAEARFDVVAVTGPSAAPHIRHIRAAFRAVAK